MNKQLFIKYLKDAEGCPVFVGAYDHEPEVAPGEHVGHALLYEETPCSHVCDEIKTTNLEVSDYALQFEPEQCEACNYRQRVDRWTYVCRHSAGPRKCTLDKNDVKNCGLFTPY